jgi:hypothetical protein
LRLPACCGYFLYQATSTDTNLVSSPSIAWSDSLKLNAEYRFEVSAWRTLAIGAHTILLDEYNSVRYYYFPARPEALAVDSMRLVGVVQQ